MAIIKCKMCGGDLNLTEDASTAVCEWCGSVQTVPRVDDENKLIRFERAERLRKQCEFDKAAGIYETIVADFRQEAEAYWGLVLCKYGIEYVDDPGTGKKIPTCHRSSFASVMEDSDLEQALENTDPAARKVYREEAKAIEELRKGIIAVSSNEEPYDIFICYKETAENGDRTLDSVLAQDVYDALTDKGYRVFFSRISLEDKLGMEYEPYIFAALNSAKVMLAFGTDYEYFNAIWVKNEWSRFLKLMSGDKEKHLIPCYKGIDAYDMPKEFAKLQAQDLGKVGATQDLLRGIEKLLPRQTEKVQETVVVQQTAAANPTVESYLKRAFMFLEDGNWNEANEYCEKVLDIDPENAWAYVGKLMAKLHIKRQEQLKELPEPFDKEDLYQKALRFGDDALKATLSGYITHIKDRNAEKAYQAALSVMKKNTVEDYWDAAARFQKLSGYKDAAKLAAQCKETAAELAKERVYKTGCELMKKNTKKGYQAARNEFQNIPGYKDTADLIKECTEKLEALHAIIAKERKKKQKIAAIIGACICAAAVFLFVLITVIIPNGKYNDAVALMDAGKYEEAIEAFQALDGYKDSAEQAKSLRAKLIQRETVSAESSHTVGLKADGTVVAVGDNYWNACNVSEWKDIIAVSAGNYHTVGLKADGTVVATKCTDFFNEGQCDVSDWSDIIAVSAGSYHTVGLKADGTVVYTGSNGSGQCDVSDWTDIIAVSAGSYHTVGLRADGTVVAVGKNTDGRCNVSDWTDIIAVSAGSSHTIGLKTDGTVVAVGDNVNGQCDVSGWKDIIAVSAGYDHTVGLKADGTVVAVGKNTDGQCDVSDWTDIIAVSAGKYHTVGLKADGTVVYTGSNGFGQCDVSDWKDIKLPE